VQNCEVSVDYERIAREFLVALRGKRSQVQWSRRLGYRSNVAYAWESGRRSPTAAELFRACGRAGKPPTEMLRAFFGREPAWLDEVDLTEAEGVAVFLQALRGSSAIGELAAAVGASRYAVSRWLTGKTQPRAPDFFRMIQATSVRLLDFLSTAIDPAALPSIAVRWGQLEARRRGAGQHPWTQAIMRAFEVDAYVQLPQHRYGWLTEFLSLPDGVEETAVGFLVDTGQVAWTGTHYRSNTVNVDTRAIPEVSRALKGHWSRVASERVVAGAPGQFSYNVFAVSAADFERIRELHLGYFRAMRAIVAESEPCEVVAVANVQLFPLSGPVEG